MKKLHTHKVVIRWYNTWGELTEENEVGRFASLNWAADFAESVTKWMRSNDKEGECISWIVNIIEL